MSLERPDVKFRLDPDYHAALLAICDAEGVTLAHFVEHLVVPVIRDRVHAATLLAQKAASLGISGNLRESPGEPGKAGR